MRTKWLLKVTLFLLSLILVIQGGTIGNVDLFVQSSHAQTITTTDFANESTDLIANTVYRNPATIARPISSSGARGANIKWENRQSPNWFIEEQRGGEPLIISGILKNDPSAIELGFKVFDWGFARQAADGSFPGTSDDFHSTSFFVQAVSRSMLFIQQSPVASKYKARIDKYKPLVRRAARWMITPNMWAVGLKRNLPYTHRSYLVAAALGLTSKLTGDQELLSYSRQSLNNAILVQLANGVNPENGGFDTSYQMVGLMYAEMWVSYFPNDSMTPKVIAMINKGLAWGGTRILSTGEINTQGNTRTGNAQEITRSGNLKLSDHRSTLRGFAYWASATGVKKWEDLAKRVAKFYYQYQ
jgi:hypothetical protein